MTKLFTLSIALLILISTSGFSQWTQKADFAGASRFQAVGFSIDGKGYIGTGSDVSRKRDFWEYDPSTDTWDRKQMLVVVSEIWPLDFLSATRAILEPEVII